MLYFAVGEYGYEGGLQVTASHNPAAYNGMKIVRRGALPVGSDTGLDKIKRRARSGALPAPAGRPARSSQRDVYAAFHDRVSAFVDASAIRPLRLVLDGVQRHGRADDRAGARSPARADVERYNFEPDGHFPNHEPNPLLEENRRFIIDAGAQRGRRPRHRRGTATPTAASSSTTPASSCPATSSPRCSPRRCCERTRARRSSTTCARRWAVRDVVARGGRHRAREPRRPRLHQARACARRTPSSRGEVSGHYYFRDFYYCRHRHRPGAR